VDRGDAAQRTRRPLETSSVQRHAFGDTKRITTEARFIAVDQKRDAGVSASTVPVVTVNIACPPINLMVGIQCFSLVLRPHLVVSLVPDT